MVPSLGTYTGDFLNSMKTGVGIFEWDDGSLYEGNGAMMPWTDKVPTHVINGYLCWNLPNNTFSDGTLFHLAKRTGEYSLLFVNAQLIMLLSDIPVRYLLW
jgi:hypothetical protein